MGRLPVVDRTRGGVPAQMTLALFADIHANMEAFNACLAHAEARGADSFAFVGDLVGYGADPGPVLDVVRSFADRGAIVVRGNHDAAALDPASDTMNSMASRAIRWTREQLSDHQRDFLTSLPLLVRRDSM